MVSGSCMQRARSSSMTARLVGVRFFAGWVETRGFALAFGFRFVAAMPHRAMRPWS